MHKKSMYMYIYICIYVYLYMCIYIYICMYTCIHMYMYTHVYMCICVYTYIYICMRILPIPIANTICLGEATSPKKALPGSQRLTVMGSFEPTMGYFGSVCLTQHAWGPQKPTSTKGSDFMIPTPIMRGIPEIMVCRMLMFMWSFGARIEDIPLQSQVSQADWPLHHIKVADNWDEVDRNMGYWLPSHMPAAQT